MPDETPVILAETALDSRPSIKKRYILSRQKCAPWHFFPDFFFAHFCSRRLAIGPTSGRTAATFPPVSWTAGASPAPSPGVPCFLGRLRGNARRVKSRSSTADFSPLGGQALRREYMSMQIHHGNIRKYQTIFAISELPLFRLKTAVCRCSRLDNPYLDS